MSAYQPFNGLPCSCRPGVQRDNCPNCEGSGRQIDFAAIRERNKIAMEIADASEAQRRAALDSANAR